MENDIRPQILEVAKMYAENVVSEHIRATAFDFDKAHEAAMSELSKEEGGVNIHGRVYKTVARRVEAFRRAYKTNARLRIAEHQQDEKGRIFMRAVVELRMGSEWVEVAEGRAEEVRGSNNITRTSATEVCETSAYGRALANFGLHGGEFASANEVENAVAKQNTKPGIGIHSPLGDTNPNNEAAQKYAHCLRTAVGLDDLDAIKGYASDLKNEGEEMYRDVWSLLDSKTRSRIKAVLAQKEAA